MAGDMNICTIRNLYDKVAGLNEAQTATKTATKSKDEIETTNRSEYKIGSDRRL